MKIMNMPGLRIAALLPVLSAMLLGCASDGSMSRTQKGAVIGGARRAKAVADYLMTLGVPQGRMRIMGFGFERPVASNDSAEGRAQNRRVEIHIVPNEDLRKQEGQG